MVKLTTIYRRLRNILQTHSHDNFETRGGGERRRGTKLESERERTTFTYKSLAAARDRYKKSSTSSIR